MVKKITKVIKSGDGFGKLYEETTFIDEVSYHVQVSQEFFRLVPNSDELTPGIKSISGTIRLTKEMKDLSGKYLKLEFSDNKVWLIAIVSGNFMNRTYEFKGAPGNNDV